MAKTGSRDITQGSIWKNLLLYFFPIWFGSIFQQLYTTVDAVIVGRYVGTEALAALGGTSSLLVDLLVGFFIGASAGAGAGVDSISRFSCWCRERFSFCSSVMVFSCSNSAERWAEINFSIYAVTSPL